MNKSLFCVNFSKFFSSYGIPRFLQNMQKEKSREPQTDVKNSLQKPSCPAKGTETARQGTEYFI